MILVDSGFEAGKKNFLQLIDKDGEQPQIASVSWARGEGVWDAALSHTHSHIHTNTPIRGGHPEENTTSYNNKTSEFLLNSLHCAFRNFCSVLKTKIT